MKEYDIIQISRREYLQLRIDSEKLTMLENSGVDNWTWYGEALNPSNEESFNEAEERITKEIMGE